MKATLEFDLPEEEYEHKAALAGHNALLLIEDLETEIASRIDCMDGCTDTLHKVWDWIIRAKEQRELPEI